MTANATKATTKKSKTAKPKASATSKAKVTKAVAKTPPKSEVKKSPASVKEVLRKWNLGAGIVLALEAVAVVVLGGSKTAELTTQYLSKDALATETAGNTVVATAVRHLADVPVSWLVAVFLLAFAATFVLLATAWHTQYESWLERGVNKLRWVGFGLGTGLMVVTVAMLSGISDLGYLILLLASVLALGSVSTIVELLGSGRKLRKYVVLTALGAAALPVLAIGLTVLGVVMYGGSLPMYLYFVYGSMSLAIIAIALACILRLRRRGKFADIIYSEKAFIGLGFIAATLLAAQVFAGVLQS